MDIQAVGDELFRLRHRPAPSLSTLRPRLPAATSASCGRSPGCGATFSPLAGTVVDDPAGLVHAAKCCDTESAEEQREQLGQLREYGKLLFDAAFGDTWPLILDVVPKEPGEYLEVAVLGSADGEHRALQALGWEALHDGERFIVAEGAVDEAAAASRSVSSGSSPRSVPRRLALARGVARRTARACK